MYVIGSNFGRVLFAYGFYKPGKNTFALAFFARTVHDSHMSRPAGGVDTAWQPEFQVKDF